MSELQAISASPATRRQKKLPTRAYWRKYFCHGSQSNWHSGSRACGVSSVMEASKEARASRSHPRQTPVSLPPSQEPSPSGDEARRHQERRASPTGGDRGRVALDIAVFCRRFCVVGCASLCRKCVCRQYMRVFSVDIKWRLDFPTGFVCADM